MLKTLDDQLDFKEKLKTSNIDNFSDFYYKLNMTDEFKSQHSDFKTFTFIRDPLMHFESGL